MGAGGGLPLFVVMAQGADGQAVFGKQAEQTV